MDREAIIREHHSQLGKLGGPARWKDVPPERRADEMEPARRGRRTNEERFRALMAEIEALRPLAEQVPALRAEVADLRQRVAA